MTKQEKQWFEALTTDRTQNAQVLEKQSMRGVQRSVVDKYSDQAHFIYELLQNADDVKATTARFRLEEHGLYFIHDGSVRFTVSDPEAEETDTATGKLGHVNAITSIANSNKTTASIGKFGVGFKAVFQYTKTPHIYDPGVGFKIERFIVPSLLKDDLDWRRPSDTVFWFPFDHKDKTPDESFDDIRLKLKALDHPVLFLSHLKRVTFEAHGVAGTYTKDVEESNQKGDITVQRLALSLDVNGKVTSDRLLTFTRSGASGLPYSIGYALDAEGKLMPVDRPAFCFFPTKEATNLKFIVHAPFLLTDSRESIKAGEKHNRDLVQKLAELAADSLPLLRDQGLIDDGLFDIIPYDESRFTPLGDRSKLSFTPFFTAIRAKLQTDALLPAAEGCSAKAQSYWASDTELVELISDDQLAMLTKVKDARWVLRTRGKKNADKVLAEYIDGSSAHTYASQEPHLIAASLDPEAVLRRFTPEFIAAQPLDWLHKLYSYLSERPSYQQAVKYKAIFLDQEGNAVRAFDDKKQLVLFLPADGFEGYTTVHPDLLAYDTSRRFIQHFGIKRPSLRDEIYNVILPAYETNDGLDTNPHFHKFFQYFKECKHDEVNVFISLIKDKQFIRGTTLASPTVFRGKASDLYMPTPDLKAWFETKADTRFVQLDVYRRMVGTNDHSHLDEFFRLLGVATTPRVIARGESYPIYDRAGGYCSVDNKFVDGLEELLSQVDARRSEMLWKRLADNWSEYSKHIQAISTHTPKGRKRPHTSSIDSNFATLLRSKPWILNRKGELVPCNATTIQSLTPEYVVTSFGAKQLIEFLGIRDEAARRAHLSDEEKKAVDFWDEAKRSGLSFDDLQKALADARKNKSEAPQAGHEGKGQLSGPNSPLIRDILKRRRSAKAPSTAGQPDNSSAEAGEAAQDADDFTPKPVDYGKKLERAKDRQASELDRLEREQALYDKVGRLPRYSYGWFLALLELECMASNEKSSDAKTLSIRFGKVERDGDSGRTILFKEPSRFIPQSIEEFSGVRVDLDFADGSTGKLRIESFTAREFSLYGKLESADELKGIDLGKAVEARIEVQNPSFLLHSLLERFREMKHAEDFDMKGNLTADIEFVFGPPGTGKTTHLAEKVLIPRMKGVNDTRVLVLTPTNKAADVLTLRIMEKMGADASYLNWLTRFGSSADERIERAGVWRDRSFGFEELSRSVTVTTIARFAYDGFAGPDGKKLREIDWDLIVIDEASMISLASIILPLYLRSPDTFIIAGDPFQIEPILAIEQWKDENIYKMVGLTRPGSFAKPSTEPHEYVVTNLDVQYRSVPAIGEVFSRFTYDGILKHHRSAGIARPLRVDGLDVKPLNLIKFPVSKFESVYRAKRLGSGTPYQTYSALFTFEFVRWLSGQTEADHADPLRVGVIAPYRAQANLLNRLIDSWGSKPESVDLQVGTVHGFQGDECDIIIAVLNPPPTGSSDPRMFLNKQNILNVAVSRARDYLVIVMPDEDTEGIDKLRRVAEIERLIRSGGEFSELSSHDIESLIFGDPRYLEENTFSTGHQMVNVYRKPERYYEVRSDDSAIDVQIHEGP